MTSTHGGALGWPRRPDRATWPDPRAEAVFGTDGHLGWPERSPRSASATRGEADDPQVSRETLPAAGAPEDGPSSTVRMDAVVPQPPERTGRPDAEVRRAAERTGGPDTEVRRTADETAAVDDCDVGDHGDDVSRETTTPPAGRPPHAWSGTRVMTVANQKGGVGKTTTAVNIAAAMAGAGLRVLVIDMDPQGNASTALSIPHASGTMGVYDVLIDGVPLDDVVVPSPHVAGLYGVPATIDLAGAEIELVPLVARENRLRRALTTFLGSRSPGEQFDLVLIDCPPSLGLLTVNSFVAADEVLIPIQCEYYALEGLSQLVKNVELIQQHLNAGLRISTILLTMFDARTRLSAEVADQVRDYFGPRVLKAAIPRSVRISEAPSHGETVITYDPASTGALSYVEAAAQMRQQEVTV